MQRNGIALTLSAFLALASGGVIGSAQSADKRPIDEWRAYGGTGIPAEWMIEDGLIRHSPGGGDLISVESFGNVEVTFDWKISPGGNSGVIYRVDESYGASFQSGPEYQILDNAGHSDGQSPMTSAASVYGLSAPTRDATRPVGEWNSARIILQGSHFEHWLNGEKMTSVDVGSTDWKTRVGRSKFAGWPAFGVLPEGHIVLQDHGSPVEYRNFMVQTLPD